MELSINDVLENYRKQVAKANQRNTMNNIHIKEKILVVNALEQYKTLTANQANNIDGIGMSVPDIINTPCNEIMFSNISNALGITLLEWQKVYILTGETVRAGQLTAYILRQLLQSDSDPMDLSSVNSVGYYTDYESDLERIYYVQKVCYMHDKLLKAGIPVRKVISLYDQYVAYLDSIESDDKRAAVELIHEGKYRVRCYVNR